MKKICLILLVLSALATLTACEQPVVNFGSLTEDVSSEPNSTVNAEAVIVRLNLASVIDAVISVDDGVIVGGELRYNYDNSLIGSLKVTGIQDADDITVSAECVFEADNRPYSGAEKTVLTFNKYCDLTSETYYAADGTVLREYKIENVYDDEGVLLKETVNKDGIIIEFSEYAVTASGELYLCKQTEYSYGVIISYCEKNEYGDNVVYDAYSNGKIRSSSTYEHSYETGKLVKTLEYSNDELKYRTEYAYTDDGSMQTALKYAYPDEALFQKTDYSFDDKGNEYRTVESYSKILTSVIKYINNTVTYNASYYENGKIKKETEYKEQPELYVVSPYKINNDWHKHKVTEYGEDGEKEIETFYEQYLDGGVGIYRPIEQINYKGGYLRTVYEYSENVECRLEYDESGALLNEHKIETVYNSEGLKKYENTYKNGEMVSQSEYFYKEDGTLDNVSKRHSGFKTN